MYRYLLSCLHLAWGSYFDEYRKWLNSKSAEEATEIIVLTIRDAISTQSFEIQGSELSEKDIKKNWLFELIQKDEFVEYAQAEAERRKKKNPGKENFDIAVGAISAALRNIWKDMKYREKNKRTYAKVELIALISSLPVVFKNEKVSKKTLKMLGFADVEKEINLDIFAEIYCAHRCQSQKTFLSLNLIKNQKKKRKKKSSSSSGSSSSNPAPAIQLSLI